MQIVLYLLLFVVVIKSYIVYFFSEIYFFL